VSNECAVSIEDSDQSGMTARVLRIVRREAAYVISNGFSGFMVVDGRSLVDKPDAVTASERDDGHLRRS